MKMRFNARKDEFIIWVFCLLCIQPPAGIERNVGMEEKMLHGADLTATWYIWGQRKKL